MVDTISYNEYIDYSPDDNIWLPIPKEEYQLFDSLVEKVTTAFFSGTNQEKGDSLEGLMTYIYERFKHIKVLHNVRTADNQIDHIVEFIDGITPQWISDNVGLKLIGESKNHDKSIGSREVSNLDELLRSKKSKLGIFSSYKSFSKGTSMWTNAEGKRRKLALWNRHERIIIGFTIKELASLKENNFYTILKQKYENIIDEIEDDYIDEDCKAPYSENLYHSLNRLYQLGIIDYGTLERGLASLESKYGKLEIETK